MSASLISPQMQTNEVESSIKTKIEWRINKTIRELPPVDSFDREQRRGIIARYASVLEGNFIYWMTAAYMAVQSEEARPILIDNLYEEVRDSHPVMLRKFAIEAGAFPRDSDALAVNDELTAVRLFLGRLSGVQSIAAMAYLEGFIQKFMPYLADLARVQGSAEFEYTDVHGVCDIAHTDGLFHALALEMEVKPLPAYADPLEGVELLDTLIKRIFSGQAEALAA